MLYQKLKILHYIIIMLLSLTLYCSSAFPVNNNSDFISQLKKSERQYKSLNWIKRQEAIQVILQELYIQKVEGRTQLFLNRSIYSRLVKLLQAATYDSHSQVQVKAIAAISTFVPIECKIRISMMAYQEKNHNVRWYAIKALALYGDVDYIYVYKHGLRNSDWLIREASIKGLLKYDKNIIINKKLIPQIIRALNDQSNSVVIATLNNVRIKHNRIYKKIKKILFQTSERKISIISAVLTALKGYKLDKKVRNKLVSFLLHDNKEIRVLSLRILKSDQAFNE